MKNSIFSISMDYVNHVTNFDIFEARFEILVSMYRLFFVKFWWGLKLLTSMNGKDFAKFRIMLQLQPHKNYFCFSK